MKYLLLFLALTVASDTVVSNPATIELRDGVEITFQSIRDDDDYYLMISIRSPSSQLGDGPCEVTVTIDTDSLLMPCTAGKPQVFSGRRYRFLQESLALHDREIVSRILTAKQVVFKIREQEVKLEDVHLKRLRTVVDSALIRP